MDRAIIGSKVRSAITECPSKCGSSLKTSITCSKKGMVRKGGSIVEDGRESVNRKVALEMRKNIGFPGQELFEKRGI